ncbi:helix-turn-helix domain-containing protein [Desulfomicrobium escambiense]|uniref:helix-turn-helix domain-containing protein n=1 Tax=Desulfomicrobium escambiense TaxID=29503 RepID=UPI0003FE0D82|nr:RodZ domain-containing protein [Desulfomicrobium escambiense]
MDLIEIGTLLRETRERKGLSIEAVEEKTKIAPSVISALEEGNRERFPHPVYARGFVRSYALLLGLDAQDLCAHFSREYPVPTEADHPEHHAPKIRVRTHDADHVNTIVRVVAIAGILALGALGWYVFDVYRSRQVTESAPAVQEPAPAPAPQAQTLPPENVPAPLTQMQEVAAEPQLPAGAEAVQNASPADAGNASAAPAAGQVPAPAAAKQPEASVVAPAVTREQAPSAPAATGGERTLRISASSASWLQARPDDKVVDYFLRKGESATITFRDSLSVKFGNAGGVALELDGKPYPFEAKLGEVKTLVVQ